MNREEECIFVRLSDKGVPVLKLQGREVEVEIHGVEIPKPLPDLYIEMMTKRVPKLRMPMKCSELSKDPAGKIHAKLSSYGWQDKSGDVWLDLSTVLLREGLARVAEGEFSERAEYLRWEQEARARGKGIWSRKE